MSRPHHTPEYVDYIHSDRWREFRRKAIRNALGRCERCGSGVNLQVHHLHYRSLGRERFADVAVVCAPCHLEADAERASAGPRL
jgi:5-methylcytosine-specific restriction endonuclease McrA